LSRNAFGGAFKKNNPETQKQGNPENKTRVFNSLFLNEIGIVYSNPSRRGLKINEDIS
jgi:hypothetical protein